MSDAALLPAPRFGAPPAEPPQPATPARLWHGRHGVPIAAVFPTEDGTAAVSLDESNHARLWPALDGTREPIAVPLATPAHVVVRRDGDGFAIAALDVSGGLEVLAVDGDEPLVARVQLGLDPGFAALVALGDGFVALRRDQVLEYLDARGARRGTLAPVHREHVERIVQRRGATLAIVRTKDGLRGRWLSVDDRVLAWGRETAKLPVDPERVFLSPDHRRVITFHERTEESVVIDLDSGRRQVLANQLTGFGPVGVPIGFSSPERVVFAFADFELTTIEWWTLGGRMTARLGGGANATLELVTVDSAHVTDAGVVAFSGHELAIAPATSARGASTVRYLGYRIKRASRLRGSPLGVVAQAGGAAVLLDEHARSALRVTALDAIPLAPDLALAELGPPAPPKEARERPQRIEIDPAWLEQPLGGLPKRTPPPKPRIALLDLAAKTELQRWPIARRMQFEPATRLLALERGARTVFARFDPDARTFIDVATVASPVTHVALLDPDSAGGDVAILARQRGTRVELRRLRSLEDPLPEPAFLAGTLEAIDRAGRIYVRESASTIAVHEGARVQRIAELKGWSIRPSANGAWIAAFAPSRLMLLDAGGARRWSSGFPGIKDAAWTPDGELVVIAGDVATIDLRDGRVIAAQCGWAFGQRSLAPPVEDFPSTAETVCDR